MELLQSYGRLIHGKQVQFVYPGDERLRKSSFAGDWDSERRRLAAEEGLYCFDLFAAGTADLFEGCKAVRELIAAKFPMIIVDEFQDTDDDQWRLIRSLVGVSSVFCLADPDQRIFDYRPEVSSRRIEMLHTQFNVTEFDLGDENHRSPNAGILQFADAVLNNGPTLPRTSDVKQVVFHKVDQFAPLVHAAVIWTFSKIREKGVMNPCVAVLCRSNALVADISTILSESHKLKNRKLSPVEHDVVWDADLSIAAAVVVASILEWPIASSRTSAARTLRAMSAYYKLKNAERPTNTAAELARKYEEAEIKVARGSAPRAEAAKLIVSMRDYNKFEPTGDPVKDWLSARRLLSETETFREVYQAARLIKLFGAGDKIGSGLASKWMETGSYAGASILVKRCLEQERLVAADRDPRGCILMNIHKAKGKEFDGVVMVEGQFKSKFFDDHFEKPPYERSRRLLRVGITRARTLVTIVRPRNAIPLVYT